MQVRTSIIVGKRFRPAPPASSATVRRLRPRVMTESELARSRRLIISTRKRSSSRMQGTPYGLWLLVMETMISSDTRKTATHLLWRVLLGQLDRPLTRSRRRCDRLCAHGINVHNDNGICVVRRKGKTRIPSAVCGCARASSRTTKADTTSLLSTMSSSPEKRVYVISASTCSAVLRSNSLRTFSKQMRRQAWNISTTDSLLTKRPPGQESRVRDT